MITLRCVLAGACVLCFAGLSVAQYFYYHGDSAVALSISDEKIVVQLDSTAGDQYTLLERIQTDAPFLSVALSPAGDRLFVGQTLNFCGDGGNVLVYDTGDLTLPPDTIPLPRKQSGPIEILIGP